MATTRSKNELRKTPAAQETGKDAGAPRGASYTGSQDSETIASYLSGRKHGPFRGMTSEMKQFQ